MLRPTMPVLRPSLWADRTTSRNRPRLEANVVTSTRPGAAAMSCSSASRTPDSEGVQPACSTRTQSLSRTSTPSSPSSRRRWLSVVLPETGVGSNLKSPV